MALGEMWPVTNSSSQAGGLQCSANQAAVPSERAEEHYPKSGFIPLSHLFMHLIQNQEYQVLSLCRIALRTGAVPVKGAISMLWLCPGMDKMVLSGRRAKRLSLRCLSTCLVHLYPLRMQAWRQSFVTDSQQACSFGLLQSILKSSRHEQAEVAISRVQFSKTLGEPSFQCH